MFFSLGEYLEQQLGAAARLGVGRPCSSPTGSARRGSRGNMTVPPRSVPASVGLLFVPERPASLTEDLLVAGPSEGGRDSRVGDRKRLALRAPDSEGICYLAPCSPSQRLGSALPAGASARAPSPAHYDVAGVDECCHRAVRADQGPRACPF